MKAMYIFGEKQNPQATLTQYSIFFNMSSKLTKYFDENDIFSHFKIMFTEL